MGDVDRERFFRRSAERLGRDAEESAVLLARLPDAVLIVGGAELDGSREDGPEKDGPQQAEPKRAEAQEQEALDLAALLTAEGIGLRVTRTGPFADALAKAVRAEDPGQQVQALVLEDRQHPENVGTSSAGVRVFQTFAEPEAQRWAIGRTARAVVVVGGLDQEGRDLALLSALLSGDDERRARWASLVVLLDPAIEAAEMVRDALEVGRDRPLRTLCVARSAEEATELVVERWMDEHHPSRPDADGALESDAPEAYASEGNLVADHTTTMLTPPGPPLSAWLRGDVRPEGPGLGPDYEGHDDDERAVQRALGRKVTARLEEQQVPLKFVAWALRGRASKREVLRLFDAHIGPEAFVFLYFAAPYCTYRRPVQVALRMGERWGRRARLALERLTLLTRSGRLQNPDALKSWYVGLSTLDRSAEGYAVMVTDAVDLVEAGHDIAIERGAGGLADILDLSERVAYQHKRVAGRTMGPHIKKAVKQLSGSKGTAGAPEGYAAVAQIDARANRHYGSFEDRALHDLVGQIDVGSSPRLDELQVLLDDRMLVYDAKLRPTRRVPYDGGAP